MTFHRREGPYRSLSGQINKNYKFGRFSMGLTKSKISSINASLKIMHFFGRVNKNTKFYE